jgi:MraZ protein
VHGFLSKAINKLDAKGRVSIPAPFRQVLTKDGFEGVYCFPSPFGPSIDAGGNQLLNEINEQLSGHSPLSREYDLLSAAYLGDSDILKMDAEGRIMLPEAFREHTGITKEAQFVGLGKKFQIWEPERYAEHSRAAKRLAFGALGRTSTGDEGGAG